MLASPRAWGTSLKDFEEVCRAGGSLKRMGALLAWLTLRAELEAFSAGKVTPLRAVLPPVDAGLCAVHRFQHKEALPLRLGQLEGLVGVLAKASFADAGDEGFAQEYGEDSWVFLSVLFVNSLHGRRGVLKGRWRAVDATAVLTMRAAVQRALRLDSMTFRPPEEVEKELSSRFISYTGEEVPKMEPLSWEQIRPALPPVGHGGSIGVVNWTRGRTRSFLLHPEDCVVKDEGQRLPKLQARVHVKEGDLMKVAEQLVERNICGWVDWESVLEFRGEKVFNGLFGVAKSAKLDDGRSHLRVIMNLIPSNAVLHQLSGCVQELPSITQYMSLVLEDGESLSLCQSDMTSAFYLFRLPEEWERYLAFNVVVQGSQIGLEPSKKYCLACRVLPMGWSSAVSVMQEVSQILLEKGGADLSLQVSRTRPLPSWLTACLKESRESRRAWYHIYLDNYFSGERIGAGEAGGEAALLHHEAEEIWNKAGVLSSEKKRVRDASEVEELGAQVDSDAKLIGASAGRLLKLLQTTCLVLSKERIPRKWLQVVCGRWVHVLQFRRAGMSSLSAVWRCIGGKRVGAKALLEARRELCRVMCGTMLFHTFLGACVSETTTASDASGTGGAVGRSDVLSSVGSDFCRSLGHAERCIKVPVLVLSLFNGVGGAFRAYDLVGVEVMGLVSFETDKSANRVSSRRWPHAVMKGDVRSIH